MPETFLMVDPVGDNALPVSSRAFEMISAPVPRVLARNCVALFLDRQGIVRRIEGIKATRNPLKRLALWLGRTAPATFEMTEVECPLEDFQTMVDDAVLFHRKQEHPGGWWLFTAPVDQVRAEIAQAESLADLHQRMQFPPDQDCLDLL